MRRCSYALALFVGAACGSNQQQRADDVPTEGTARSAEEAVALSFAWPTDRTGTLRSTSYSVKKGKRSELAVTYTVTTAKVEQGWTLAYTDARDIETPELPEEQRAMLLPMIEAVPPQRFVDGEVVEILEFEAFVKRLQELFAPAYEAAPELEGMMASMWTEEFFLAAAKEDWQWRGSAWHGKSMKVGEPIVEESEVELMMTEQPASATTTMTLHEVVPCPGAEERECVRLEHAFVVDSESMEQAMAQTLGAMFETIEAERSIVTELIADPATLLPYRATKVETTNLVMVREGNDLGDKETKRTTEIYTWE